MHTENSLYNGPMGYQFAHIDSYARKGSQQRKNGRMTTRKWSIRDIAAEAMREPDACRHVAAPKPPRLLHGVMPDKLETLAEAYAATVKDAAGRKLRADGLCVAAGVVSLPADRADDWPQYRAATLAHLKKQYGKRLRSVIEHTDEEHPHLHFYAIPLDGERFEVLHAGRAAAAEAAKAGKAKGAQNAAYKAAMQAWQDDFHETVAAGFGLARTGPKRQRLTRAQWQARKAQLRADAQASKVVGRVITPEMVKKRVTKKGKMLDIGTEYETAAQLAARLDAAARKAYAPVARAAAITKAAQHKADSMEELATVRGEAVGRVTTEKLALQEKVKRATEATAKVQAELAMYKAAYEDGLSGTQQEQLQALVKKTREQNRERYRKHQAQQQPKPQEQEHDSGYDYPRP